MPIFVEHRRTSQKTLKARYGDPVVLDVTSRGPEPWVRFSPFYPHGSIPIPFSLGQFGASVEGIWQGLKVFESADVDRDVTMKGIKRSERCFGEVLGHRAGLDGDRLLPYLEARRQIYLPCYLWVLQMCLVDLVDELEQLSKAGPVILFDFQTNGNVEHLATPLSHAALVKQYVEGDWPGPEDFLRWTENIKPDVKRSDWFAQVQGQVSPSLKAELVALAVTRSPGRAMRKLEEATGVDHSDCSAWVKEHIRSRRIHRAPNPCPFCGKLLRTMLAKQCLECGMDWHDPKNIVRHST